MLTQGRRAFSRSLEFAVAVLVLVAAVAVIATRTGPTTTSTTTSSPPTSASTSSSSSTPTSSTSSSSSSSSISSISTGSKLSNTVLIPAGSTFQVTSSFDCVAGHFAENFTVPSSSDVSGAINATGPGVTVYVSTAEQALNVSDGHPSMWVYDSGLTNSTSFDVTVTPGAYTLWIEGDDMGCGATVVEPLEMLTTVTVTQEILLEPS